MDDNLSILLASQPILDRDGNLAAAELLYRNDRQQGALEIGEELATSELIYNLCTGISEQLAHRGVPVFINVSADFLLSRGFLPVPPQHVVIELVERIEPTPEIIECVAYWRRQGFRFALDDFGFSDSWAPLLDHASFIKVDVLGCDPDEVLRRKAALEHLNVLWLAERIETREEFESYREAGFDLFQGYFFARPQNVRGRALPPSAVQLVRLINVLYRQEACLREVADCVQSDPSLAFKLIRIANSPFYRGVQPIESVHDVVMRLGLDNLRRWAMIFGLLQGASREHAVLVLARARLCELIAMESRRSKMAGGDAYLVGLMSGVDLLLGLEPAHFIKHLDLKASIRDAVADERGPLGELLNQVRRIEHALLMKRDLDRMEPRLLASCLEAHREAAAILGSAATP